MALLFDIIMKMKTKEEIIKDLQNYSKKNNGKTPSEKVFYDFTGLGIYDLRKYGWSCYGELVKEAGLIPNKFDKTKYSKNQLCELFIEIVREKGRWPTRGELEVKHNNNPTFPSHATFYNKLGLTRELAKTILNFVDDKKGYDDIIEMCNSVIDGSDDRFTSNEESNSGYVYLGKQHGNYKIGKSKDTNRRREDITLLGSEPFELIHEIKTDDINGVEKYWHTRFKLKLLRGEWFKLSPSDAKAFKRWKKIF